MATDAGYKRCSSPALNLSRDPVVDDCSMSESQLPHPRKRQRTEQRPLKLNGISQPQSKRQKLSHHSTGSQPPPAFWDNLSKIWLTKRALRELNRRNSQSALSPTRSQYRRARRPVTRNFLAELKRNRRATQSAADFLRHCEPRTLKDIKLFARYGGPDLSDLRGFPEPVDPLDHTMSSSQSSSRGRKRGSISTSSTKPTTNTTTTKSTGPYDRGFQQNLIDGGIYPHGYRYPDGRVPAKPNNWDEINQRLAQPRASLSPSKFSEEAYEKFVQADVDAFKEKQVTESVIPIVEGEVGDAKCRVGGIPFTNLDHLTDGTLVPGNPDLYYGARPEQLDRRVRNELSGHIVPSTQDDLPIAPNFFLAAKGPDGSAAVAKRQASYDGALGARGMHSLQSYGESEPTHDNNAYTITSTYHDGTLKMYTVHPTPPAEPNGKPSYHMTQLNSWSVTGNPDTFRQGAGAFRHGRDLAKEWRDDAIARANEKANEGHGLASRTEAASFNVLSSFASQGSETSLDEAPYTIEPQSQETSFTTDTAVHESETSADELSRDITTPAKRSSRHSTRSQQPQRKKQNAGRPAATTSTSQSTSATNATAQESERWSWTNGKFQCHKGQSIVKEQSETPADV